MTKNNNTNTTTNKDNNNNKNRILLVDDEVDITTAFTLGLEDSGFKVNVFNDPEKALSDFKRGSYDLAILDYKMPKMNGFELYRGIRKIDDKIKICFITAFEMYHEELRRKFQNSSDLSRENQYKQNVDVRCFIQKPIDIDEFVKRIKGELNSWYQWIHDTDDGCIENMSSYPWNEMIATSHNKDVTMAILLVDNESDNTSVLSMALEDEGFKVDAFNDPVLALSNFRSNFYSLLIFDINMPKMNGYELYKEIRKLDNKVKVCFLTASEIYDETLRVPPAGLLDGVNCFIPKPVDIDQLVGKVKAELDLEWTTSCSGGVPPGNELWQPKEGNTSSRSWSKLLPLLKQSVMLFWSHDNNNDNDGVDNNNDDNNNGGSGHKGSFVTVVWTSSHYYEILMDAPTVND